jgi:hypothetical protein
MSSRLKPAHFEVVTGTDSLDGASNFEGFAKEGIKLVGFWALGADPNMTNRFGGRCGLRYKVLR